MVRFINATVVIYQPVHTLNDEGDYINDFTEVETILGDVQPVNLTEAEMSLYGINTVRGNIRKFFYNGLHPNVKAGNRAEVESTLSGKTEMFEIMPIQAWTKHGVCLLVPCENEGQEIEENGD